MTGRFLFQDNIKGDMGRKSRGAMDREEIKRLCRKQEEPIITSKDVAQEFGVTQQGAYQWLKQMHEEGELARRKVGGAAVVWWPIGD